jgi:hypothetical protein
MKRSLNILLLLACMMSALAVWAQTGKKTERPAAHKPAALVYLGHSSLTEGDISKQAFDSLLKQGLTAKDSLGKACKVYSFMFNYGERNLYEDSMGTLTVMTDYMMEECPGDTLTPNISASIYDRTKAGDTAYFDSVMVMRPDNTLIKGKSMKFFIKK